jgi:hypothetical protein
MKYALVTVALLLPCSAAHAQGCYGGSYQAPLSTVYADSEEVTYETVSVQVPVRTRVRTVAVQAPAPQAVAVAAPQCQTQYAAPQVQYSAPAPQVVVAAPQVVYAQPIVVAAPSCAGDYGGSFRGVSHFGYGSSGRFVRTEQFGGFGGFGGAGGGRSVARLVDRRGDVANVSFDNSLRVRRGLLGNIRRIDAN